MPIDRSFTLANWMEAPYNRPAFRHIREIVPTAAIECGDGSTIELVRDPVRLDDVVLVGHTGDTITWAEHLATSYCDAVCVVHDGRIVAEWYVDGMDERTVHLLMSVSKSFCGAALGIAVGQGRLDVDRLVTEIAPEFAGTSLEGATVRHVIDMTAGTDFVEDYDTYAAASADDPRAGAEVPLLEYERHAGYRPLGGRRPLGTLGHFRTYGSAFAHGERFQYRSPLTNVAARLIEVVNDLPYASVLSRDLWGPMGMEHPADIMLDPLRHPVVEGGMSCTVRDLARFGLTYLDDGVAGGHQVVPADWVADTHTGDEAALAAFEAQQGGAHDGWAMYRNAFWVMERATTYSGLGIFGQYCWIDRPTRTVIARFSTTPVALPEDLSAEAMRAFAAVAEHLGEHHR